jgi:hypothetical protein
MVFSWKLDIAGARNMLGQISPTLNVDGYVFGAVNDQRGYLDCWNDTTDIDLAIHAHECGNRGRASAKPLEPAHPLLCGRVIRERGREQRQGAARAPGLIDIAKECC